MAIVQWIAVGRGERVIVFRDACPVELLGPGRYLRFALGGGLGIERLSTREPWVQSFFLEEIVRAGVLEGEALVLDLAEGERALVRVDGKSIGVRGTGLAAVWTSGRTVEVERFSIGFGAPASQVAI